MLEPWIAVVLLGLESSEVMGLRIAKLARGGVHARREADLVVNEKIVAALDVGIRLLCGATDSHAIDRFREHVAASANRLATEPQLAFDQE